MKLLNKQQPSKIFMIVILGLLLLSLRGTATGMVYAENEYSETLLPQRIMSTLTSLDIVKGYDDGSFGLGRQVTRAEAATMMIRLLGVENIGIHIEESPFSDVGNDHWALQNIYTLNQLGIINGYGDGTFGPEDLVTFHQTVRMMVSTLGFDPAARTYGEYPMGYLRVAAEQGILKNIEIEHEIPLIRADLMHIIYNSLDVDMMVQVGAGDNISWEIEKGKTLRNELLNILNRVYSRGQVSANYFTSISDSPKTREGYVEIDGELYHAGDTNAAHLLGYRVIFRADETSVGDTKVLKMVQKEEGYNLETVITAKDIDPSTISRNSLRYTGEGGVWEQIDFSHSIQIIYNGKAIPFDIEALKINTGTLRFVDVDSDALADLVFISVYETHIVQNISMDHQRIELLKYSDKADSNFTDNFSISLNQTGRKVSIFNERGEKIDLGDLKKWDVISVSSSNDRTRIDITISNQRVIGSVSDINYSDGSLTIGDNQYDFAVNANGEYILEGVRLGKEGIFLLDIEGRIFYAVLSEVSDDIFVYLMDISTGKGLAEENDFMVIFKTGEKTQEIRVIPGADHIIFNNQRMKNTEVIRQLKQSPQLQQPIRIELDSLNHISMIETLEPVVTGDMRTYIKNSESFDNIIYLTDNTTIFFTDFVQKGNFVRKSIALNNGTRYYTEVYYLPSLKNSEPEKRVVVIKTYMDYLVKSEPDKNNMTLIESFTAFMDEDENLRHRLVGIHKSGSIDRVLADTPPMNEEAKALKQGDLVYFGTNEDGEIDSIKKVVSLPQERTYRSGIGGEKEQVYGTVVSKDRNADGTSAVISIDFGGSSTVSYEVGGKPVYVYNTATGKAQNGSFDDIRTVSEGNTKVFLAISNLDVMQIVVVQ